MFDGREFCLFDRIDPFYEELENRMIDTVVLGSCCLNTSLMRRFPKITQTAHTIMGYCEEKGINFRSISEYYTSQTCLFCNSRRKPDSDRFFRCPVCLIEIDRDLLGAANIYRRAIGTFPEKAAKLIISPKIVREKIIKPRTLKPKVVLPKVYKIEDMEYDLLRKTKIAIKKRNKPGLDIEQQMGLNNLLLERFKKRFPEEHQKMQDLLNGKPDLP